MATNDTKCRIAEITQYSCVPKTDRHGYSTVHCVPIPRLFRLCPGSPAVEVTRVLDIDFSTGYIEMPKALEKKLPCGKPWQEVVKNTTTSDSEHASSPFTHS